jgi:hypothetical protein
VLPRLLPPDSIRRRSRQRRHPQAGLTSAVRSMDLVGRLSNQEFQGLLQRLTSSDCHQVRRTRADPNGPAPDGRRPFGQVKELVAQALQGQPSGLRVRDVHARAELLLGEPVSWGSVKAALNRLSKGDNPRFVRIYRGWYRLCD